MQNQTLKLPDSMRDKLREPFGELIDKAHLKELEGFRIIAIGDFVAYNILSREMDPDVIVIDNQIERKHISNEMRREFENWDCEQELTLENKPGFIDKKSWNIAKKSLEMRTKVVVSGEEDLLVIPFTLTAPNGWRVVYGLPKKGAVIIVVDDKIKDKFKGILKGFEKWS